MRDNEMKPGKNSFEKDIPKTNREFNEYNDNYNSDSGNYEKQISMFIAEITKNSSDPVTRLFDVLEARGLFFVREGGSVYLSDNLYLMDLSFMGSNGNGIGDNFFIRNVLKRYKLGDIEICDSDFFENYGSVAKVNVTGNPEFNDLCKIFSTYSGFEGDFRQRGFFGKRHSDETFFYAREHGLKVPALVIEPGIARFVKSISACGVSTTMSCDGHFELKKSAWLKFNNYLDTLWFRLIMDCLVIPVLSPDIIFRYEFPQGEQYMDVKIVNENGDVTKYYLELQRIAIFLYNNRIMLRKIKNEVCRDYQSLNPDIHFQNNDRQYRKYHRDNILNNQHSEKHMTSRGRNKLPNIEVIKEEMLSSYFDGKI